MKFLKTLVLILLIIMGVWAILCALGPKTMSTERSMVMNASPSTIYNTVADFKTWSQWSPWEGQDSTMVTTYEGADSGEGAVMKWTSQSMGGGRQEIVKAVSGELIETKLNFDNFPGENKANWHFEEVEEGTKVTWTMDGAELGFFTRGFILLFDGVGALEKSYDDGLAALKEIVESKPAWEPEHGEMDGLWYIGVMHDGVTEADLKGGNMHAEAYGQIGGLMAQLEVQPAGMPITVSRAYLDGVMDLTFAMPVADSVAVPEGFIIEHIPAGPYLSAIHKGPYETVGTTWDKFDPYLAENQVEYRYYPYEQYVNDPADVKDSTEYLTRIVYPVK